MIRICNSTTYSMEVCGSDRRHFWRLLIIKPIFLFRHIPFLCAAILRRISTRLKLAVSTRQLGTKGRLRWINRDDGVVCVPVDCITLLSRLPRYPTKLLAGAFEERERDDDISDPEDYLADNRWARLINVSLGNEEACNSAIAYILAWIARHSDKNDAAWETYSVCERVGNSLLFFARKTSNGNCREIPQDYIDHLCSSLIWIRDHLEYYGDRYTNNHILNNARALVMGGAMLAFPAAMDAGIRLFREFLPKIVTKNGCVRERSSHYQLIVMSWVVDALMFLRSADNPDPEGIAFLQKYAEEMLLVSTMLVDDQGQLCAMIGDVSPDCSPHQVVAKLSTLYSDLWPLKHRSTPHWEIRDGWFRLSAKNGVVLGNFVEGGFPLPYPTHGHNDLTGFVWSTGGCTILTDPGRFRYTPDPLSLMQKSAVGHSVPLVNGFAPFCETLRPNGQWWPMPYARATATIDIGENEITLSHDGFSRATPVKRHIRKISLADNVLEVVDAFEGDGEADVDFCWHFSCEYSAFDEGRQVVKGTINEVGVELLNPETRECMAYDQCVVAVLRESRSYGKSTPSLGLKFRLAVTLPVKIMTRFTVSRCAA